MNNIKTVTLFVFATFGLTGCIESTLNHDGSSSEIGKPISETEEPVSEPEVPSSPSLIETEYTSGNGWVHADQNKIQKQDL